MKYTQVADNIFSEIAVNNSLIYIHSKNFLKYIQ